MWAKHQGFTIVELLIVIVVIGILAAISLVAFGGVQQKSRDSGRVQALKSLEKAIEMYRVENGSYPPSAVAAPGWAGSCSAFGSHQNYITGLVPTYIPKLVYETYHTTTDRCYLYRSNGTDYSLIAHNMMESSCGSDTSDACNTSLFRSMDRSCCIQPTIGVFSTGGSAW